MQKRLQVALSGLRVNNVSRKYLYVSVIYVFKNVLDILNTNNLIFFQYQHVTLWIVGIAQIGKPVMYIRFI